MRPRTRKEAWITWQCWCRTCRKKPRLRKAEKKQLHKMWRRYARRAVVG